MHPIPKIAALVLLAGCSAPTLPEEQQIDGVEWILSEVNGLPWQHDVSMRLDDDRVSGVGPCNAYSGTREGQPPALKVGALGSTRMACLDSARMQAEAEYLDLLSKTNAIRRDHSRLVLTGPGISMVFDKREAKGNEVF